MIQEIQIKSWCISLNAGLVNAWFYFKSVKNFNNLWRILETGKKISKRPKMLKLKIEFHYKGIKEKCTIEKSPIVLLPVSNNFYKENFFDKSFFNNVSRINHFSAIKIAIKNKIKNFPCLFFLKHLILKMKLLSWSTISTKLDLYNVKWFIDFYLVESIVTYLFWAQ